MANEQENTIDKYDRLYGKTLDVCKPLVTKASTIRDVEMTGRAETFIVQTMRHKDLGDYLFIECIDEKGHTRIAIPPKVASLIGSQHDSLTRQNRRRSSRAAMKVRMEAGFVPAFARPGFKRKRSKKAAV